MAKEPNIQQQIDDLDASKYDTRWEAFKGFAKGAWRPVISFGAIGLAIGTVAVGGIALLGALGLAGGATAAVASVGGAASAIALSGAVAGGSMAAVSGAASAMKSVHQARQKNDTLQNMENTLQAFAREEGVSVTPPAAKRDLEKAQEPQTSQTPAFVQKIIKEGSRALNPREITKDTINDAREGLSR